MANKRLKKKQQKKQQLEYLTSHGYSEKQIRKSNETVSKLYHKRERIDRATATRKRKQEALEEERKQKLFAFEIQTGIQLNEVPKGTKKRLDKVSIEDIKKGYITVENFPEFYKVKGFNFNELYKVPKGKKLYFAFRSLNGEVDISQELQKFDKMSNAELIKKLEAIKETAQTGSRNIAGSKGKNIGSSGKAGEGKLEYKSQQTIDESAKKAEKKENRNADKWFKLLNKNAQKKGINFSHSAIDFHWQYIQQKYDDGNKRGYDKISAHKLLVIGNAIMHNITEDTRQSFYNEFYVACCDVIPEMKKFLP